MLREMLVNLVDNAIRYTPVGGKVTVSVTRLDGRALLTVEDVVPESIRWTASTFSSDFTGAWERRKRQRSGSRHRARSHRGSGRYRVSQRCSRRWACWSPCDCRSFRHCKGKRRIGCLPETSLCATRLACSEPPRQCNRTITYKIIAQAERRTKVQLSLDFLDLILSSFFRPGEGHGGHKVSRKPPCGLPLPLEEQSAQILAGALRKGVLSILAAQRRLGNETDYSLARELTRPLKNL
ncbi:ATP-binding protein [Rhizobium sp. BK176]|uniref:ATP-binding protein n=1 Tax=Rhizobium sp. BK176 TaxID=2587071 RepID=UPI002A37DF5B|nr:hypothetical protein [Rhizobium sp. BK176]